MLVTPLSSGIRDRQDEWHDHEHGQPESAENDRQPRALTREDVSADWYPSHSVPHPPERNMLCTPVSAAARSSDASLESGLASPNPTPADRLDGRPEPEAFKGHRSQVD